MGRAREGERRRVGQRIILAAMRFVGHDDDVGAIGQLRIASTLARVKVLNEREDVAVIFAQQLLQVIAALRPHGLFRLDGRAGVDEVLTWYGTVRRGGTYPLSCESGF